MARGFESKSVADQQAEAENKRPARSDASPDPALAPRRRNLELARADALQRLEHATDERYRTMLSKVLAELDRQIRQLG